MGKFGTTLRRAGRFIEHVAGFFDEAPMVAPPETMPAPATSHAPPPVLEPEPETCATCAHFDLAAGQAQMHAHGPFRKVIQHLQPWELAQSKRKFEPSPEYEQLRTRCNEIMDALNTIQLPVAEDKLHALESELEECQRRMAQMNPQQLAAPDKQTTSNMYSLRWEDVGMCTLQRVGVWKSHSCHQYQRVDTRGRVHLRAL